MREITKELINNYNIKEFDFMGYTFRNTRQLSYHHLIVPHKYCKQLGLGDGYYKWNGSVLVRDTAHDYLHIIEVKDKDMFIAIRNEMIEENIKGRLDVDNIRKIHDILGCFEREHSGDRGKKGKLLIRDGFLRRKNFKK